MKKTSKLNPVKSYGYIKCYSSSSPRPITSPTNYQIQILSDTNVRRSAIDREDLNPYWKSEKKGHISLGDQQSYCLQVFTNHKTLLTTEKRLTGR